MDFISDLREEINSLDDKIMNLLNERFERSLVIGERKSKSSVSILDTNRETFILEKSFKHKHSPQIAAVYTTIMTESKNLQRK